MKKIIVFFLCVMVATASLFAAGGKEREPGTKIFAVTGGYQGDFYFSNGASIDTHGIALGIDSREMYTEKVGFFAHMGVNFPVAGYEPTGNLNIGVDSLFAPAFMPVQTEKLTLNVNPGVHFGIWLSDALVMTIGLGVDVSTYFYLSDSFFLASGLIASYDFFALRSEESLTAFHIKPRLGLGFRW